MRTSVERLRFGLLAVAGLLVLVIAAFLGYARYKMHRGLANLPGKLGATITKEFNGWTWSQSDGKKTIFTIHASKAVEHKDGTVTLHDVSMVLYGKKGDRADRISGDDFEYDTKNEVIRAIGTVHLDLQAPHAEGVSSSEAANHLGGPAVVPAPEESAPGNGIIHIETSGLVYLKTLGIAATNEGIEFAFGGFTGHAVGAEYNSDTGHVILQSAVTGSGLARSREGGHPVALTASHGEFDRANEIADLDDARYTSAGEIAQADVAHIHMRADGSVEHIEGVRHVLLEDAGQGSVTSDRANVSLDPANRPTTAVLTGSVHFADDEPLRQAHGDSDRASLGFDPQGNLDHAVLAGHVHTAERLRGPGDRTQAWSERELTSDTLDLALVAAAAGGKPQLREAKAAGSARLVSVAPDAKSGGTSTAKLSGDILAAHFILSNGVAQLSTVHGTGQTLVEQLAGTGIDQTSSGNALDAVFRPSARNQGAVELATAVQQGGVAITRTLPAKKTAGVAAAPEVQHATAAKAVFDADAGRLTLTGNVQMSDATSTVSAARVVMLQGSGDAAAAGSVKVSYSQSDSSEPVHVLSARAELNHDANRATFYGSAAAGGPGLARMWQPGSGGQGGSQIEAPVLVFEQEQKRLIARAETPGALDTVHAVLADTSSAQPVSPPAARVASRNTVKPLRKGAARITSSLMVYTDADRKAEFTGGVRLLDADGEMRARQATVFLTPAGASPSPKAATVPSTGIAGLFGGSIERIVATGEIEITQPDRKATGERLVYTASDQLFVLTGTPAAPPRVVDALQGNTTGAALLFRSGDDSVVVSGRDGDAPAQKVRTETTTKGMTKRDTRKKQ